MKNFARIHEKAHNAAMVKVFNLDVIPMTVVDKNKHYFVEGGVCGFAYVNFKGNTGFGRWMKKNGSARKKYNGGLCFSVQNFNQSLQKKECYAREYVKVLGDYGIEAYVEARMD